MTRETGQEKIDALTPESSAGDVADAFVTRYSDALDGCVSNLPTTRAFLAAEGVEKESQLDADGKRRHRAFLLQEMEKAVETGYLLDRKLDNVDQLTDEQRDELAERTETELAKWRR